MPCLVSLPPFLYKPIDALATQMIFQSCFRGVLNFLLPWKPLWFLLPTYSIMDTENEFNQQIFAVSYIAVQNQQSLFSKTGMLQKIHARFSYLIQGDDFGEIKGTGPSI